MRSLKIVKMCKTFSTFTMATMTVVKKKLDISHNSTEVQYQTFILENEIKYVHELQTFSIITFFLLFSLFLPLSLSLDFF